ncbi:response regulator transcription factor [Heyndrickxia acidicola]|uniref:Response regulator transcription factor n=1 Tax=Heyndrickxia acidicola TaxID=209389 RepID=A0ABU6MMF5_9BACI|nr:response regulator transcription factor [Heyndrickxia acidicola]MED1205582.1 response regulator transcription factor [Heyndrickxia acidicola]
MERIKVMLVEDEEFWRQNITFELKQVPDIQLTIVAASKSEVFKKFCHSKVDVALVDLCLTKHQFDGLEVVKELKERNLERIIVLTSIQDKEIILKSFDCGTINYITKSSCNDIVASIRDAYHNKVSLHADVTNILINELKRERKVKVLTPLEREVYELKEQGLNKKQIAHKLYKSVETVKRQLKVIKSKIN